MSYHIFGPPPPDLPLSNATMAAPPNKYLKLARLCLFFCASLLFVMNCVFLCELIQYKEITLADIGNGDGLLMSLIRYKHGLPKAKELAKDLFKSQSAAFCPHVRCQFGHANYDPIVEKCRCAWGDEAQMYSSFITDKLLCGSKIECHYPFNAALDINQGGCVCSVDTLPPWDDHSSLLHDPIFQPGHRELSHTAWEYIGLPAKQSEVISAETSSLAHLQLRTVHRQQSNPTGAVSEAPVATYVPPPKTDVTAQLIQQSLDIQPQKIATVHSVVPWFGEGIISYLVQLDGPIAETLLLNATDSLPCAEIGDADTNVILVPQTVYDGIPEVVLPTCLIIAINMYEPDWITYWVLRLADGSMFSVLGDNKVHDIDQLNTSASAALVVRAVSSTKNNQKRLAANIHDNVSIKRHQIFQVACNNSCPHAEMLKIDTGNDDWCGCTFNNTAASKKSTRGLEAPDSYTATMTPEVCAAMTCINNGNQPALYNMFTRTCWCITPQYVGTNPSAYSTTM